jgi:hypothetical protein
MYSVQSHTPTRSSKPVQIQATASHRAAKQFLDSRHPTNSTRPINITNVSVTNIKGKTMKFYVDVEKRTFFKEDANVVVPPSKSNSVGASAPAKRMLAFAMNSALSHNKRLDKTKKEKISKK